MICDKCRKALVWNQELKIWDCRNCGYFIKIPEKEDK